MDFEGTYTASGSKNGEVLEGWVYEFYLDQTKRT